MYLRPLTVPSMEKVFCEVLKKLGVNLDADELPTFVRPLLQHIPGVPRQLQLVFAAVAQSNHPHEFQKSKLLQGLRMPMEHPERFGRLPHVHYTFLSTVLASQSSAVSTQPAPHWCMLPH